ncbi:MAG: hypothetical protein ACK5LG_22110 [Bacteroides thetaiotaomicron]
MFIEFFRTDGEPISVSLLNIVDFEPSPLPKHTYITTSVETIQVKGDYKDIRDQIRSCCK